MVVIRLSRRGTKNNPKYRVTVADSRKPLTGRFLEVIGHFNPLSKDQACIDKQKYESWIKKGAQPSLRVKNIFKKLHSPSLTQ